jgi:hypothetical protein
MLNISSELQRALTARTIKERKMILSSCIEQYEGDLDEPYKSLWCSSATQTVYFHHLREFFRETLRLRRPPRVADIVPFVKLIPLISNSDTSACV